MKNSRSFLRLAALVSLALVTLVAAFGYTFVLNKNTGLPIKWPAGQIPLRLMLGAGSNPGGLADGTTYDGSATAAAQIWNALLGSAQFQVTTATGTPTSGNSLNELAFSNKIFGKDFDEGTLAVTTGFSSGNERVEADITFNTAYTWDSYRGALRTGLYDLRRVALHELGHVLGLDHPDEATPKQSVSAIMNSRIGSLDSLTADDTEAAQSLYGPPGAPINDQFASATVITLTNGNQTTLKGYNTNATRESGEPRQGDNPGGRSVWWRWTAPSAGSVRLDTKGSYFDTTLGVYTGTSVNALTKVADNDDINPGVVQASDLTFSVTSGTTYRIAVDGYNGIEQDATDRNGADNGGLTLNLNFTSVGGTLPVITTQPSGATVNSGASVSFSVTATGTEPLSYQWRLNDVAISGATAATYSITSASAASAGNYSVVVTNAAGSVTSNNAVLTVNTPTPPPPAPSGGGGGGGGAPSAWFLTLLGGLGLHRLLSARRRA